MASRFELRGCPPRHANVLPLLDDDAELEIQIVTVDSIENDVAWHTSNPAATKPCSNLRDDAYYARAIEITNNPAASVPPWHRIQTVQLHGRDRVGRSYHVQVHVPLTMAVVFPETHNEFERDVLGCFRQLEKALRMQPGSVCNAELRRRFQMRARSNNWVPDPKDKRQPKKYPVALVSFKNRNDYNKAKRFLEETSIEGREGFKYRVTLWETADYVKPHVRFMLENDMAPGQWIRIQGAQPLGWTCTTCDVERWCLPEHITPIPVDDDQSVCPLTILIFDLEVKNGTKLDREKMKALGLDKFPTAINPTNAIIQISVVVRTADGRMLRFLLELDDTNSHTGSKAFQERVFDGEAYTVIYFQHEEDMLVQFRDMLVLYDADIVMSFNGDNFDW